MKSSLTLALLFVVLASATCTLVGCSSSTGTADKMDSTDSREVAMGDGKMTDHMDGKMDDKMDDKMGMAPMTDKMEPMKMDDKMDDEKMANDHMEDKKN